MEGEEGEDLRHVFGDGQDREGTGREQDRTAVIAGGERIGRNGASDGKVGSGVWGVQVDGGREAWAFVSLQFLRTRVGCARCGSRGITPRAPTRRAPEDNDLIWLLNEVGKRSRTRACRRRCFLTWGSEVEAVERGIAALEGRAGNRTFLAAPFSN
jgi:hypothetical protein